MDNAVFEWVAEEFKKQEGIDLRTDKMAVNRVKEAAEKAKIRTFDAYSRPRSTSRTFLQPRQVQNTSP